LRHPRVTLLAFSGGIDSTYLLAQLLNETDDIVIAHHVHMVNAERRWQAEAAACWSIVDYCRAAYRDFHYTQSTVERMGREMFGWDIMTAAAELGAVAHHAGFLARRPPDVCLFGLCSEEEGRSPTAGRAAEDAVDAILRATCMNDGPPYFRHDVKSKAECMDYMGPELSNLCWTCRKPRRWGYECGHCKTCKLMQGMPGRFP